MQQYDCMDHYHSSPSGYNGVANILMVSKILTLSFEALYLSNGTFQKYNFKIAFA